MAITYPNAKNNPFVINHVLNIINDFSKEDYNKNYNDGKFEEFFKSVFKNKIKKLKCEKNDKRI
jgi:hypothetical protein